MADTIDESDEVRKTNEPANNLQNQIEENQKAILKVSEGLAQVSKVISQPNNGTTKKEMLVSQF